jgi:hypothetical protein
MMPFLAQAIEPSFWNAPSGTTELYVKLLFGFLLGAGLLVGLLYAPSRARRPIVVAATFLAGLIYVLQYYYPRAIERGPNDLPLNAAEGVAFWLEDAITTLGDVANTISAFMLGLGVYSLLRIHSRRLFRMQKDWSFSLVLIVSLVAMLIFGYGNWLSRQGPEGAALAVSRDQWSFVNYGQDLLFDGLLQQMDAAMFSLIAFFILSAAYRAFRIRSIEATILLATALIVMLSLMGAVEYQWNGAVDAVARNNPESFLQNFTLTAIRQWIQENVQNPSLRAIDFGIGIGALAMALRLWLSLERSAVGTQ